MINILNGTTFGFGNSGEVYIGRNYGSRLKGSPLANPFPVSKLGRAKCIELYKYWLLKQYSLGKGEAYEELLRLKSIYEKEGSLTLVCWCKPKDCHGDVIKVVIEYLIQEEKDMNNNL